MIILAICAMRSIIYDAGFVEYGRKWEAAIS